MSEFFNFVFQDVLGGILEAFENMDPKHSAQDIVWCDICETPVPPMCCDICHINLCKACVGEHISDELTNHRIVSFSKLGGTVNFPKCQTHCPKICELHCKHCNIPICASCVFSGDHEHHQKEDILKYMTDKKKGIEKDLSELNKSIYPEYQKCATNLIVLRADVRKNSQELKTNLIKKGEALHTEIDTIIQGMKSDIDDMDAQHIACLLYTSPSPRDLSTSRMPSSA